MCYFIKLVRSLKIRGGSELISEWLSYPVFTGLGLQAAVFCFVFFVVFLFNHAYSLLSVLVKCLAGGLDGD